MPVRYEAHAKINLTLEVLDRREDGFHEVATVMQMIDLSDDVVVEPASRIIVECDDPTIAGPDNLVNKAARSLREEMNVTGGARVSVCKRIPVSAGLGGGSSDAAAVLLALNKLWNLGLNRDRLAGIGAELGSDIPFFVHGGTALAEGRGELITPLPPPPATWLVLAVPPITIDGKTPTLYRALRRSMFTDGAPTQDLVQALREGQSVASRRLFNVFEQVIREVFPNMDKYWSLFQEAGASHVHLAGSGPSLFTLVNGPEAGRLIAQRSAMLGLPALVVKTVGSRV